MAATPSPCRASCLPQDIPAARGNTVTLTTSNTCTTQTAAAGTIASRRSRAPAATSSPATAGTTTATRGTGAATVSNRAEAVTGHKTTGAAAATAIIDGGGTDTRHGGGEGSVQRLKFSTNIPEKTREYVTELSTHSLRMFVYDSTEAQNRMPQKMYIFVC